MFFLSYSLFLSGQNTQNLRSDSPTFNAFRHHSTSLDQVQAYVKTIYPKGRIILDPENSASLEFDDIPDLLSADPESSFELISESTSKLNPDRFFYKYQQFHQGVKVENGGYTILAAPPGAVGGCEQSGIFGIAPAIATGININTTATISQQEAATIIGNNVINTSEALIDWGLTEADNYHLVYKVDYQEGEKNYRAWINAHDGSILRKSEISMNLEAFTFTYGEQNLNDKALPNNGGRILQTEDCVLKTYNFPDNTTIYFAGNYDENLIPTTTTGEWNDPAIRIANWQTHFCASNVIPVFNDLINEIDEFTNVNIGVSTSTSNHSFGAGVVPDSDMDNTFLGIGSIDGRHTGLHDVIAHELAHVFLTNNYLANEGVGPKSLQEGIADIFGTYIESIIQNDETINLGPDITGGLDWIMADDRPEIAARDLENPQFSTWEEVMNLTEEHDRGEVIGHWFYLISQGSGPGFQVPIPPLGIEKAITIVLDALQILNNTEADYPDFMEAVEMAVDLNWDPCSMETTSVRRAFRRIGLGDSETCAFVNVKSRYCESDAAIQLCIEEGFSDDQYRWYFPSGWTVQGAGNTNSVTGNCLTVLDWPEYAFYPQIFSIRLYNITQEFQLRYNLRMEDCEGDDPSCNDVGLNNFESNGTSYSQNAAERTDSDRLFDKELPTLLKIFDINGRKVYEGKNFDQSFNSDNLDGLLIYCYYDQQGKIIETKKMVIIK